MYRQLFISGMVSFLFFIAPAVKAQQTEGDKAVYRCIYEVTTLKDTTDVNFTSTDVMGLDIGKSSAIFYSLQAAKRDSIIKAATRSGSLEQSTLAQAPKGVNKYVVYLDLQSKKTTYLYPFANRHKYYYEEDLQNPVWKIHPDKAGKLDYNCQRATCSYKGREYEAWFTTEIPLPYGPCKFGGLPGLILEIHDTRNHYMFKAIGFEELKPSVPITCSLESYKKITKKDFQKIERDVLNDPIAWMMQNTGVKISGINTPQERAKEGIKEERYSPIELTE